MLLEEEMEIKYRIGISQSVVLSVQGDYGGWSLEISLVLIMEFGQFAHLPCPVLLSTSNFNSPCSKFSEQYQKLHET